jgi:ParB family chromosome partitioning protein
MTELTAHRTLALREAVANDPDGAFLAMLHALCLRLFYRFGLDTCLEVEAKSVLFGTQIDGLGDMPYATAIDARHGTWAAQLPKDTADLWDVLSSLDGDSRQALFAHCVGLTINATCQPYDRRPKAIAHADRVAEAVQLDIAAAGWRPAVAGYLGRVTKAQILEAVREAKGEQAAQLIGDLKKADMAREAERLLEGAGWLPEPLRLRGVDTGHAATSERDSLPAFLADDSDDSSRAVAAEQRQARFARRSADQIQPRFIIASHLGAPESRPLQEREPARGPSAGPAGSRQRLCAATRAIQPRPPAS